MRWNNIWHNCGDYDTLRPLVWRVLHSTLGFSEPVIELTLAIAFYSSIHSGLMDRKVIQLLAENSCRKRNGVLKEGIKKFSVIWAMTEPSDWLLSALCGRGGLQCFQWQHFDNTEQWVKSEPKVSRMRVRSGEECSRKTADVFRAGII